MMMQQERGKLRETGKSYSYNTSPNRRKLTVKVSLKLRLEKKEREFRAIISNT